MEMAIITGAVFIGIALYMSVRYIVDAWSLDQNLRRNLDRDVFWWQRKVDKVCKNIQEN